MYKIDKRVGVSTTVLCKDISIETGLKGDAPCYQVQPLRATFERSNSSVRPTNPRSPRRAKRGSERNSSESDNS